jgi:hypothetical protein
MDTVILQVALSYLPQQLGHDLAVLCVTSLPSISMLAHTSFLGILYKVSLKLQVVMISGISIWFTRICFRCFALEVLILCALVSTELWKTFCCFKDKIVITWVSSRMEVSGAR